MKLILKSIFVFIVFLYMLLISLPKENIYYFILERLAENKIEISQNTVEDKYIRLDIENMKIKYNKIDIATIDVMDIKTILFKTDIIVKDIKVKKHLKKYLPYDMDYIIISHTILNPFVVNIKLSRQFKIKDKNINKYLIKTDDGYKYEYKF